MDINLIGSETTTYMVRYTIDHIDFAQSNQCTMQFFTIPNTAQIIEQLTTLYEHLLPIKNNIRITYCQKYY
jgi:hypothetical protein